jgi:hypothetical protein
MAGRFAYAFWHQLRDQHAMPAVTGRPGVETPGAPRIDTVFTV